MGLSLQFLEALLCLLPLFPRSGGRKTLRLGLGREGGCLAAKRVISNAATERLMGDSFLQLSCCKPLALKLLLRFTEAVPRLGVQATPLSLEVHLHPLSCFPELLCGLRVSGWSRRLPRASGALCSRLTSSFPQRSTLLPMALLLGPLLIKAL